MLRYLLPVVPALFVMACAGTTEAPEPLADAAPPAKQAPSPATRTMAASEKHAPRAPKAPAFKAPLSEDLALMERLLNTSSAAKQIQTSGNPQAMALYASARERLQTARQSEGTQQRQFLTEAKGLLFQALRRASPSQNEEKRRHYISLRSSTQALLKAHASIQEESASSQRQSQEQYARQGLSRAEQLFTSGQLDQAQSVLNETFQHLRGSLIELREGATLVRSLSFASPAKEYAYEVKRHQSHRLLVDLLLQKKKIEPATQQHVEQSLQKAEQLRQQAAQEADAAHHTEAIKSLENATRQLLRAIRQAGIYIPG